MHVVDNVGNWSCEPDPPGPIKVTVVSPTRIIRLEGNLNFGDIQVGSSSQRTLTIYNDGNYTLTVTRIDYPTGFSGDWPPEVSIPKIDGFIPAGSSQNVTVTFAPTQVVTYGGYLTVNSDATSGANTKLVSGTGIPSTSSPQVTTNDASNIASTSAQLNGNLDSTGNLSCQVWFEYGKTTSYGDSTPKESKSSVGFFNDTVYSLDPNTIYHFRACASNTEGTVYSADKTFNTPMLGDFGCANDGPPDCKVDFEDLMIFALAYSSTPSDTNWNPVCDIASEGSVLEPDGVIDFEDLMVFTMNYGECAPPSAPILSGPGSSLPSPANYTVSWSSVSGVISYKIEEATSSSFSGAISYTVSSTSKSFSHIVTTTTTYYYRVAAVDDCGQSVWSNVEDITVVIVTGPVHNLTKNTYYTTIQEALDDAGDGNIIEVADGTYEESITSPFGKVIILQSANGNPYLAIIQGDSGFPTVKIDGSADGTTIKGFTITHADGMTGNGIYITNNSNINMNNCDISGNNNDYGGGIDNDGTLDITSSTISGNSADWGGGIDLGGGTGTITIGGNDDSDTDNFNTFTDNKKNGIISAAQHICDSLGDCRTDYPNNYYNPN